MPVKKVKSLAPSVPSSLQGDLFAPGPPGFDIAFEKVARRLPSRSCGIGLREK